MLYTPNTSLTYRIMDQVRYKLGIVDEREYITANISSVYVFALCKVDFLVYSSFILIYF